MLPHDPGPHRCPNKDELPHRIANLGAVRCSTRPLPAPLAEAATFSVSLGLPTDAPPSLPGLLLCLPSVTRSQAVSDDRPTSGRDAKAPADRGHDAELQPVSNRMLAIFLPHCLPRSCWATCSLTSWWIFRARKIACCRTPKTAQPLNCRPAVRIERRSRGGKRQFVHPRRSRFVNPRRMPANDLVWKRQVRRYARVSRSPASIACSALQDSRPRFHRAEHHA